MTAPKKATAAKAPARKAGAKAQATKKAAKRADHGRATGDDAKARDDALRAALTDKGEASVQELADLLKITKRQALHAVWRNRVERGGLIEHLGKGRYRIKTKATRTSRSRKAAAPKEEAAA